MKTFYIFLGVQGSGKSTIYRRVNKQVDLGERINQDAIVKKYNLNDDSLRDVIMAASIIYDRLKVCSVGEKSFNYETTIPSNALFKFINIAKQNGFEVRVCWVYLHTLDEHLQRIQQRVQKGGHDVHTPFVVSNFQNRFKYIEKIIELCDEVSFFDNTERTLLTAKFENGECVYKSDEKLPFESTLCEVITK